MALATLQKSPAFDTIPATIQAYSSAAVAYGALGYISGWNAASGRFAMTLSDADASGRPAQFVNLIPQAAAGVSTWAPMDQSLLGILDTSGGSVGDTVYLSTTPGLMTLTAPTGAARVQRVGVVTTSSATVGVVQLVPFEGLDTIDLSSIDFQGPANFTSASATALTVGRLGSTTPAFTVDASAGTQTAGLKVVGAALNGTVALVVTDTSGNTNLTINALGSGTIGIGSVSTGAVTITPATTVTGLLTTSASIANTGTYTGTSASAAALAVGRLGATTPAFSVDASAGTQTAGFKVTGAALNGTVALVVTDTSGNTSLTINALGSGTIGIGSVSTGAVTITPASNHTGLASFAASVAVTGQVQHGATNDGSTPGTSTSAFKAGTPPVGAATTTSKIYASATVMRKIIADGTDSAVG